MKKSSNGMSIFFVDVGVGERRIELYIGVYV